MRYFWQKTFGDVAPYLYDKQNIVEPVMEFVQMKELSELKLHQTQSDKS